MRTYLAFAVVALAGCAPVVVTRVQSIAVHDGKVLIAATEALPGVVEFQSVLVCDRVGKHIKCVRAIVEIERPQEQQPPPTLNPHKEPQSPPTFGPS